jgi:hypothetical protein
MHGATRTVSVRIIVLDGDGVPVRKHPCEDRNGSACRREVKGSLLSEGVSEPKAEALAFEPQLRAIAT